MTESEIRKALTCCEGSCSVECPYIQKKQDCGIKGSDKKVYPNQLIRKVLQILDERKLQDVNDSV